MITIRYLLALICCLVVLLRLAEVDSAGTKENTALGNEGNDETNRDKKTASKKSYFDSEKEFMENFGKKFPKEAVSGGKIKIFTPDQQHFGLHPDSLYFNKNDVDRVHKRSFFCSIKHFLGGQGKNTNGHQVEEAAYPFIISTRSILFSVSDDRYEVKQYDGIQFFAVHHGKDGHFVLNLVRSGLVRDLANNIIGTLKWLDYTKSKNLEDYQDFAIENLKVRIRLSIQSFNEGIRKSMENNQKSWADSTIAIVTEHYVITVNVGKGSVLAYTSMYVGEILTPELKLKPNVFGQDTIDVDIEVYDRKYKDGELKNNDKFLLLLLETRRLVDCINQQTILSPVVTTISQSRRIDEQDLYKNASLAALNQCRLERSYIRWDNLDHTLILVGLNMRAIH